MKDVRAPGAPLPALHYWMPDRSGNATEDYRVGREHFYEAVRVSFRQGVGMLLPYVVMAMYGKLGPMEYGFLDALLKVAQVGAVPHPLTDDEMAAEGDELERERAHEREMADAIGCRKWAPDMMRVQLFAMLAGVEGEHIGAAITMIARTAANGMRN